MDLRPPRQLTFSRIYSSRRLHLWLLGRCGMFHRLPAPAVQFLKNKKSLFISPSTPVVEVEKRALSCDHTATGTSSENAASRRKRARWRGCRFARRRTIRARFAGLGRSRAPPTPDSKSRFVRLKSE